MMYCISSLYKMCFRVVIVVFMLQKKSVKFITVIEV
jgi:hypothetical protein